MKQIFSVLLALTCTVVAWAQNNVITYTASSKLDEVTTMPECGIHTNAFGGLTITSHEFDTTTKEGTITFSGDVTTVGYYAFNNSLALASVTLPESLTSIGNQAFSACLNLTSIEIPQNVTSIGDQAFFSCTALKSLSIPQNVTSIGSGAFAMSGLESLTVAEGNTTYKVDGNCLISIADNTVIAGIKNSVIPSYVTAIGGQAFKFSQDLTSITIPAGVTSIGDIAFSQCSNLTSVAIPGSVTSIGMLAFYDCSKLSSVTVEGQTPGELGMMAFDDCASDLKIYVPAISLAAYKAAEGWSDYADKIVAAPLTIDATNFPDENFRDYVSDEFDEDEDGQLSAEEIAEVTSIEVLFKNIETLQGIEYFTALEELQCTGNKLTKLDITKNTALKIIHCNKNQLTALDLSNNIAIKEVNCFDNKLTSIDLSNNTAITELNCSGNQLIALDLSYNTAITYLDCCGNVRDLGEVDINGFTVEGLDMSKVSNVSGATVKDGKFVPTDNTVEEITYTYDTQCALTDQASQTFKLKVTPVAIATALTAPAAEKAVKAVKVIENGEIVIIKNGERFNLRGAKIK